MSVFANFGSINKVPILDQAINDDDEDYADQWRVLFRKTSLQ
ncbi:MAG: hypothetical protein ACJZ15_08395 [Candidatus Neomarinimicrobiota bacterium]